MFVPSMVPFPFACTSTMPGRISELDDSCIMDELELASSLREETGVSGSSFVSNSLSAFLVQLMHKAIAVEQMNRSRFMLLNIKKRYSSLDFSAMELSLLESSMLEF